MIKNLIGATAVANRYWEINDEINRTAREFRPTRNGPVSGEMFLHYVASIPDYPDYARQVQKFHAWICEQRAAIPARKPQADFRFALELHDLSTGAKQAPCFDLNKAASHFRAHPEEFILIITD